jgi:mRNA export factor
MTSPLKYQTRCVANFIEKNGFALGSVEGRVAINYIQDSDSSYVDMNIRFHSLSNDINVTTYQNVHTDIMTHAVLFFYNLKPALNAS